MQVNYTQGYCDKLTGHCWHSPVDLPNKTPPHISQWAGWSVCSIKSHYPLQRLGRSCRSPLSRSSHGGRSGTSEPPWESDKTADRGGSRTMGVEPALEEWMTLPLLLLWCTSLGSPTLSWDLVPMETTGSRQCGPETEQRRHARSSPCSPVSSSSLFLFSSLIYLKMCFFNLLCNVRISVYEWHSGLQKRKVNDQFILITNICTITKSSSRIRQVSFKQKCLFQWLSYSDQVRWTD